MEFYKCTAHKSSENPAPRHMSLAGKYRRGATWPESSRPRQPCVPTTSEPPGGRVTSRHESQPHAGTMIRSLVTTVSLRTPLSGGTRPSGRLLLSSRPALGSLPVPLCSCKHGRGTLLNRRNSHNCSDTNSSAERKCFRKEEPIVADEAVHDSGHREVLGPV